VIRDRIAVRLVWLTPARGRGRIVCTHHHRGPRENEAQKRRSTTLESGEIEFLRSSRWMIRLMIMSSLADQSARKHIIVDWDRGCSFSPLSPLNVRAASVPSASETARKTQTGRVDTILGFNPLVELHTMIKLKHSLNLALAWHIRHDLQHRHHVHARISQC